MQWKLMWAFAAGALMASVIVYVSVRPDDVFPTEIAQVERAPAPQPVTTVLRSTEPVPVKAPTPAPVNVRAPIQHAIVREKPSPMPPPVRKQPQPAPVIAQAPVPPTAPAPPAPNAAPKPLPQAVLKEVSLPDAPPVPAVPAAPAAPTVTLTSGTLLPVRIGQSLSSARNQPGDSFLATLTAPLVIDGWVIAERGARAEGRVVEIAQPGRVSGTSRLAIALVRISTSDGQNVRIRTDEYKRDGSTSTGTDAAKIGGGAALGAIIGAIAGGGRGAAIGAGAGGALGAGDVLLTRGKAAEIPVETRVSFRVLDPVTITERLN